jgi:hypothetical protein
VNLSLKQIPKTLFFTVFCLGTVVIFSSSILFSEVRSYNSIYFSVANKMRELVQFRGELLLAVKASATARELQHYKIYEETLQEFHIVMEEMTELSLNKKDSTVLKSLADDYLELRALERQILDASRRGGMNQTVSLLQSPLYEKRSSDFLAKIDNIMNDFNLQQEGYQSKLLRTLMLLVISSGLLIGISVYLIFRSNVKGLPQHKEDVRVKILKMINLSTISAHKCFIDLVCYLQYQAHKNQCFSNKELCILDNALKNAKIHLREIVNIDDTFENISAEDVANNSSDSLLKKIKSVLSM